MASKYLFYNITIWVNKEDDMIYRPEMIGKRIARLRDEKKLTQKELAGELHVSVKQLSLYENGKVTPNIDMLFSICELLDCDFGFIML